jgi:hypothetical protein
LFAIGGAKTKKSREKIQKPTTAPLISPNVLKNKLLKRIKEHKQRETVNLESGGGSANTENNFLVKKDGEAIDKDEFMASIDYLKTLSEERKRKTDQVASENKKQQRHRDLERNTVKHYQSMYSEGGSSIVNLELPTELSLPTIQINTDMAYSDVGGSSPYKNDLVPYGILKGGQKQTYRDWNKTQRNNIVTDSNLALTIQGGHSPQPPSARESRLAKLRDKLKQTQQLANSSTSPIVLSNMTSSVSTPSSVSTSSSVNTSPPIIITCPSPVVQVAGSSANQTIATKRTTTKTTKRKYTLGKSKIHKSVAVLIKDRGTRKQILNAQKDLKKKPMNDVKSYLRDHNLIKAGSNAPNDVVRKMYEFAMLTGEIKNSNVETLLHNFSKDDKEL